MEQNIAAELGALTYAICSYAARLLIKVRMYNIALPRTALVALIGYRVGAGEAVTVRGGGGIDGDNIYMYLN